MGWLDTLDQNTLNECMPREIRIIGEAPKIIPTYVIDQLIKQRKQEFKVMCKADRERVQVEGKRILIEKKNRK